jgi:Na+/H+-dicarboxylate symporter
MNPHKQFCFVLTKNLKKDFPTTMSRFLWLMLLALGLGTKRHWHILFAIILGATLGLVFSNAQDFSVLHAIFKFVGQLFIRLVQMLVIPLVVSSLVVGVTSVGDHKQLGRMGGKVFLWFLVFMVISSFLGLGLALVFEPGIHLQPQLENPESVLNSVINTYKSDWAKDLTHANISVHGLSDLFLNLIPKNPIQALANMEMLPLVLFTFLFSSALTASGETGRPVIQFFEGLFQATMKLTDWVFLVAVPGIFSLTFIAVATAGTQIFQLLAPYAMLVLAGLMIQTFVIFPIFLKVFANVNFLQVYKAISEAIMVAFGTASSSATLPVTIACCERRAGISNRIASFVLPTGASINKTGTTMFEAFAVVFLCQAYGIHLDITQLSLVVLFAILASVATPGVPSAGLITMSIVISSLGGNLLSIAGGIALLWPIDRALDMLRTTINVICSCTVSTLVAAQEGELNREVLSGNEQWENVIKSA